MAKMVIALIGPTAIGKTSRAITLANHFNTEIVSTDSRQFYKEMSIGTAVPSAEELGQARHHFIQHLSIFDTYTVGAFEQDALRRLQIIFKNKDVVIVVGGSALFMDALLYGLDDFPAIDSNIRNELNTSYQAYGISFLQSQLKELDPDYYSKVDLNNPHRIIRALEVCISSGVPYSSFLGKKAQVRPFSSVLIGLHADREVIYQRINKRVDKMMESGLLEEAKALYPHRNLNALNTVGYKEIFAFIEGKNTLSEAVEEIKKNTRRFAKRQLTWYRKNKSIEWLDYNLPEKDFIEAVHAKIQSRT